MPHLTTLLFVVFLLHGGLAFSQRDDSGLENRLITHLTTSNLLDRGGRSYAFSDADRGDFNTVNVDEGLHLGISYSRIKANGNYYRLGLIGLDISESTQFENIRITDDIIERVEGGDQSFSRIVTQFEFGKYFKRERVSIGAGAFFRPDYFFFQYMAANTLGFDSQIQEVAVQWGLNPIVELALGNTLSLTAQLPLSIGSLSYSSIRYENPFLIERDRKTNEFTSKVDFEVALQMGLAVRF